MLVISNEKFKELLDNRFTNEQLAAHLNCSIYDIKKYKRDNNFIGYKTNKKPLTVKDINFLESCVDKGLGFSQSCKLLGISTTTVAKYIPRALHELLNANSMSILADSHRVGTLSNFIKPSNNTAYFCGLLQSDGNITDDGCVNFVNKDKDLVLDLAKFMGSNVSIYKGEVYRTQVKEVKLTEKFKQLTGIYPRKTYTNYTIPEWILANEEFVWSFIVGVFNGDGSVAKKREGTVQLQIEQHSSQTEFLQTLNKYLGWKFYSYDYAKVQTSDTSICKKFFNIYSNNEHALLRKVARFEELLY